MSVIDKIAHNQGRRDEIPNQELARELAETKDCSGIEEIVSNLSNPDKNIRSDCIKVLYEIGYIAPSLIACYQDVFLDLLKSKNNRLVWGSMIALSTIAEIKADDLFSHISGIQDAIETGSVITIDNGIKALAIIAAQKPAYNRILFPYLINHLQTCRPKDIPQHAEKTLPAVTSENKQFFIDVLKKRMDILRLSQANRVAKTIRLAQAIQKSSLQ